MQTVVLLTLRRPQTVCPYLFFLLTEPSDGVPRTIKKIGLTLKKKEKVIILYPPMCSLKWVDQSRALLMLEIEQQEMCSVKMSTRHQLVSLCHVFASKSLVMGILLHSDSQERVLLDALPGVWDEMFLCMMFLRWNWKREIKSKVKVANYISYYLM